MVGSMSALWLAEHYLLSGDHITSDFTEYCQAVIVRSRGDLENFTRNRSMLAALPAALLLPRLGLVDAMTAPGAVSVGCIAAGAYLWARALHGRLAGVASAVAIGLFTPMVLMSRMMSFYPEITAVLTLAAGLTAVAARVRTPLAIALASAGAGLCFLIDMRGLIFALPYLGLITLVALSAPWRRWPVRLAIPVASVLISWRLAAYAYLPRSASLEGQIFLWQRLQDRGLPIPPGLVRVSPTAYVWGHSDPLEIPLTLYNMNQQAGLVRELMRNTARTWNNYQIFIMPWYTLISAATVIVLLALLWRRGRAWRLITLAATCVPFVLSLRGAVDFQQASLRFIAAAEPWLAVMVGLAFACLVEGAPRQGRQGRWGTVRALAAAVVALLLVLGSIPSPVSPVASWRKGQSRSDLEVLRIIENAEQGDYSHAPECTRQLILDRSRGLPSSGTLYGGITR